MTEAKSEMQLIAIDILADLCGLSLGLILLLLPVGFVLWLLGWWSHRFWIVLAITVLAGIFGLNQANSWQAQPIIAAVLLAIAAGVLALDLVRVIAFIAGGVAGHYLVQMLIPSFHQSLIVLVLGGLLSLLLFRWCFMVLTSLLGSSLMAYAVLALLDYYELLDAVTWSDDNRLILNSVCCCVAVFGLAFQFFLHRWQTRRAKEKEEHAEPGFIARTIASITAMMPGKKKKKNHAELVERNSFRSK